MEQGDTDTCCEIYRLNEHGRFPPEYFDIFRDAVTGSNDLFLVAEFNEKVVAFGGVRITPDYVYLKRAAFSYGIIHPDFQQRGIGTALFLARIAILPDQPAPYLLTVSPVPKSRSFFKQFGFLFLNHFVCKKTRINFELLGVVLRRQDRLACRKLLDEASIMLDVRKDVPLLSIEEANADYFAS